MADPNPLTIMRKNVELCLSAGTALTALGVSVKTWSDPRALIAEDPLERLRTWLRVDPNTVNGNQGWSNDHEEWVYSLNLMVGLPANKGLKADDIENLIWAIRSDLARLRNNSLPGEECEAFERFVFRSVSLGLIPTSPTNQDNGERCWAGLCVLEIVLHATASSA